MFDGSDGDLAMPLGALSSPMTYDQLITDDTDPSLSIERVGSPDWLLDPSASSLFTDDLNVTDLLGLDEAGLSLLEEGDDCQENCKETFQTLATPRYREPPLMASTPVDRNCDSGFMDFMEEAGSSKVLHDITDQNRQNHSFLSITSLVKDDKKARTITVQNSAISPPKKRLTSQPRLKLASVPGASVVKRSDPQHIRKSGDSQPTIERNIGIIRKKVRCQIPMGQPETTSAHSSSFNSSQEIENKQTTHDQSKEISDLELKYYTGLNEKEAIMGLLKFVKIPSGFEISSFRKIYLTMMKLRLNLEWTDIAFRFSLDVDVVKNVVRTVLPRLAYSIVELIPWHVDPPTQRNYNTIFYLHPIYYPQIKALSVILMGDLKRPIIYISKLYETSEDQPQLHVLFAECIQLFVEGDMIYVPDQSKTYRITYEQSATYFREVPNQTSSKWFSFLRKCRQAIDYVSNYALANPKNIAEADDIVVNSLRNITVICCALANLNLSPKIKKTQWMKIHQRAYCYKESNVV